MTTEVEEVATTPETMPTAEVVTPEVKVKKVRVVKEKAPPPPKPEPTPGLHLLKDLGLYKYDLAVKVKKDYDPEQDAEEIKKVQEVLDKRGQVFGAEDCRVIASIVYSPADKRRIAEGTRTLGPDEKSAVSAIEVWRAQINQAKYSGLMNKIAAWEAEHPAPVPTT